MSVRDPGHEANVALLREVVVKLGALADSLVFVGGCATGLLVTAVRAQAVRVTVDVDTVARIETIGDYHAIERRLEQQGFARDHSPDAPICRWVAGRLHLDVMPSNPHVLGFSNRWYPLAIETAQPYALTDACSIRLVTAPIFVATKLEAFRDRGRGDFVASHDLEDIVTVIDGRAELIGEVASAPDALRTYLRDVLGPLVTNDRFLTALAGHLPGDGASQGRLPLVIERFRKLAIG
jgi:predicted nucleotidyltransferase